jgi:hypothetical protein
MRHPCEQVHAVLTCAIRYRMQLVGLPVGLILGIAYYLAANGLLCKTQWDAVEFFAGCGSWSRALRAGGLRVAEYEIKTDSELSDMLGDIGFITAVQLLLQARAGALVHFATVCSSWVMINRGTSKRSSCNPLGCSHPYVVHANVMVSRTGLLMLLALCLNLHVILEQPASSLMFLHPRIAQIVSLSSMGLPPLDKITTFMGAFGAATPKMTMLLGSPPWLRKLARGWKRSYAPHLVRTLVKRAVVRGRKIYTGMEKVAFTWAVSPGRCLKVALQTVCGSRCCLLSMSICNANSMPLLKWLNILPGR